MIKTLASKIITARKDHFCDLCSNTIEIGEKYEWQKNICDGETYENRAHVSCCLLAKKLNMYEDMEDCGVSDEDFRVCIDQAYDYYWESPNNDEIEFEVKLKKLKEKYGIS
jgi:hypothetical protein